MMVVSPAKVAVASPRRAVRQIPRLVHWETEMRDFRGRDLAWIRRRIWCLRAAHENGFVLKSPPPTRQILPYPHTTQGVRYVHWKTRLNDWS